MAQENTITLAGLAAGIAESMENIPATESKNKKIMLVRTILERSIDKIKETIEHNGRVSIKGFGRFEKRHRNARTGRNPQDPSKSIEIAAKDYLGFKSSCTLDKEE